MKKLLYLLAFVFVSVFAISCEQEDISPSDEMEIMDEDYTEESGGERDSGVRGQNADWVFDHF